MAKDFNANQKGLYASWSALWGALSVVIPFRSLAWLLVTPDGLEWAATRYSNDNNPHELIILSPSAVEKTLNDSTARWVKPCYLIPLGTTSNVTHLLALAPVNGEPSEEVREKIAHIISEINPHLNRERNNIDSIVRVFKSESMLRYHQAALESTATGILALDAQGVVKTTNKNIRMLLEIKEAFAEGKLISEILPRELATVIDELRIISREKNVQIIKNIDYTNTSGWTLPLEIIARPLHENGTHYGLIIHAQCTAAARRLETLEESEKTKSEFISTLSHELRSPLTSVREGLNMLLDGLVGEIDEEAHDVLAIITKNVEWLTRLVCDLLDLSRIENGKMVLHKTLDDMPDAINEIADRTRPLALSKNLSLSTKIDGQTRELEFDRDRVGQVIVNFLSNAIKFTHSGGQVIIGATFKDSEVIISVEDTGVGISENDIPLVFDRFEQVGASETRTKRGTGLGLAISKEIIKLHGGKVWVESELNKGSQFKFTIPFQATP